MVYLNGVKILRLGIYWFCGRSMCVMLLIYILFCLFLDDVEECRMLDEIYSVFVNRYLD